MDPAPLPGFDAGLRSAANSAVLTIYAASLPEIAADCKALHQFQTAGGAALAAPYPDLAASSTKRSTVYLG
jgi:hypothetical protein